MWASYWQTDGYKQQSGWTTLDSAYDTIEQETVYNLTTRNHKSSAYVNTSTSNLAKYLPNKRPYIIKLSDNSDYYLIEK